MLAGTALYICLMVYMGLSLFIIRRALCIYGCMRIYAYNLTWRGLKNGKSGGEPNGFCLISVILKKGHVHFWNSTFKFQLFQEIFFQFRLVYSQSISDRCNNWKNPPPNFPPRGFPT